jgi:hypothetical protein
MLLGSFTGVTLMPSVMGFTASLRLRQQRERWSSSACEAIGAQRGDFLRPVIGRGLYLVLSVLTIDWRARSTSPQTKHC